MSNLSKMFDSSLGRKLVMSLTGLFLCSFLMVHLIGNLQLFYNDGGEAFNHYTKFMSSNWVLRLLEIGLILGFGIHIAMALRLTRQNAAARPIKYEAHKTNETSSWYSRNMGLTGSIIFIFLVMHLANFWYIYKFNTEPTLIVDGEPMKDMYTIVAEAFKQSWLVALYTIGMVMLGLHLNHGFQSAFQSLGLKNKSYSPLISKIGSGFAILMVIGFTSFPILFFLGLVGAN